VSHVKSALTLRTSKLEPGFPIAETAATDAVCERAVFDPL
jgi:hypothetical protein